MKRKISMEVKITHFDQVKFAIQSRSHSTLCDQPAENGGEDSGLTPPQIKIEMAVAEHILAHI
jgi:hypothetical protein